MKQAYQALAGAPKPTGIRNPLPHVALTALRSIQTTKIFPKGYEFFLEGQAPQGVYMLYEGNVELTVTDAHGRQMGVGTALPGEVLGLSGVLSGKYYEETAVAALTCRTGFIKASDFLHFLDHHPEAAFWVVQLLSDRVTATLDKVSCIHFLPIKGLRQ